ncbi:MAG TPA: hypothetical protein VFO19_04760, partial [Vicinamibacterales bacterium]|nr:hypothetical protein [Vicinamibacterales bacterium]
FLRSGQIFKTRIEGGPSLAIAAIHGTPHFCTWGTQHILCSVSGRFVRYEPTGGEPIQGPAVDVPAAILPAYLPDGRHFLFFSRHGAGGGIYLAAAGSDGATVLGDADSAAAFAPPDRVLFVRGTTLLAQRLDLAGRRLVGDAELVASGVSAGTAYERHLLWISASQTGVLAYQTPRGGSAGQLTWFDRNGRPTGSIPTPTDTEFLNPAISPDGTTIAANRVDPQSGNWDVWLVDIASGAASRFTTDAAFDGDPVWSPDGKAIAFMSERSGTLALYRQPIGGGAAAEHLLDVGDARFAIPSQWTSTGEIIYHRSLPGRWQIWAVSVAGDRTPVQLIESPFGVYAGRLSPDGEWIAFNSFENGPVEVFVQRVDVEGPRRQISFGGGVHPRWTNDGELIYWAPPAGIFAHTLSLSPSEIRVGPRRAVVDHPVLSLIDARTHYDVSPDGERLLVRQPAGPMGPGIKVVLNWASRLRR